MPGDDLDAVFALHGRRVARLAAALVADAAAADDVAQEVWLRALQSGHVPRRGGLWPWLARTTRRLAVDRARSDSARARRERETARSERVEPLRAAEARLHALQRLLEALRALSAQEREAVLLVLVQELSHVDAAAAASVPLATLRVRLARGRRHLREALERSDADPRTDLWPGLATVAAPALAPAARSAATAVSGTASAPPSSFAALLLGATAMTTSSKLLLAVGCASALWFLLPRGGDAPVSADVAAVAHGARGAHEERADRRGALAEAGRSAVTGPAHERVDTTAAETRTEPGLWGTVVDEAGAPIADALVVGHRVVDDQPEQYARAVAHTDAGGGFRLLLVSQGPHVVSAATATRLPDSRAVDVEPERAQPLAEPLVLWSGAAIEGLAVAAGLPVPDARVTARLEDAAWRGLRPLLQTQDGEQGVGPLGWDGLRLRRLGAQVRADEDGGFVLRGLERERYTLELRPSGSVPLALHSGLPPDERAAARQGIAAHASGVVVHDALCGLVLDLTGFAAADGVTSDRVLVGGLREDGSKHDVPVYCGREALLRVAPGLELTLDVELARFEPFELTASTGAAGEVRRLVVPVPPLASVGDLVLRVEEPERTPDVLYVQLATDDPSEPPLRRHVGRGEGEEEFALEAVPPGRYTLEVREGFGSDSGGWLPWTGVAEVVADETCTVALALEQGALLTVGVRDSGGTLVPAAVRLERLMDGGSWTAVPAELVLESGRFRSSATDLIPGAGAATVEGPLHAGRYALEASFEGHEDARAEFELEAGTERTVTLELERR